MRKQNLRKVAWDKERNRAYVLRDGIRYWAPLETLCSVGDDVQVFSPDGKSITVKFAGLREKWEADTTSPGQGG